MPHEFHKFGDPAKDLPFLSIFPILSRMHKCGVSDSCLRCLGPWLFPCDFLFLSLFGPGFDHSSDWDFYYEGDEDEVLAFSEEASWNYFVVLWATQFASVYVHIVCTLACPGRSTKQSSKSSRSKVFCFKAMYTVCGLKQRLL